MKKTFFYLAMAVMTVMSMTACGSDDDDDNTNGGNNGKSAIVTPKYAGQACNLTPASPVDLGKGYSLQTVELSESGRCYFSVKNDNGGADDVTVLSSNYKLESDHYKVDGKLVKGTVKVVGGTRAGENVKLIVNVNITLLDGTQLKAETDVDGGIDAIKQIPNYAGPTGDPDIISTWKVRTKNNDGSPAGLLIDLQGDVNLFKTFSGGYLGNIRDEAIRQGAEFTASEKKDFEKTVEYVTIKKDRLTIDYSDGTCDEGDWSWASSEAKAFNLKMLSKNYGNKFIVEDSKGAVEFKKENGWLNVRLEAKITGNKNYMAYLTLQLEQVAETK